MRRMVAWERFIPTCVGNTPPGRIWRRTIAVHPHMRGEYGGPVASEIVVRGSSPHAWGILRRTIDGALQARFIPTCVGNTQAATRLPYQHAVHPHVRGEYAVELKRAPQIVGSSPRAWGILFVPLLLLKGRRFIPTCVGNTLAAQPDGRCGSVHPHVRGEYHARRGLGDLDVGSSPRAWGILLAPVMNETGIRFIPTCVGNTQAPPFLECLPAVHPHVRGDYVGICSIVGDGDGSSPRAWGILVDVVVGRAGGRFIPTCVGNTGGLGSSSPYLSVHPHVRGEYRYPMAMEVIWNGSSPRAWGIRHWR